MLKNYFAVVLCVLLSSGAWAQVSKSGKVTNRADGSPLQGVSVTVKGTTTGTSTDAQGNFTIQVPSEESVLVFTYTGYDPVELSASSATIQNVTMAAAANALSEVVVIGYGTARKSELTGAVASIKAESITDKPVVNITQALQGKIAGVEVSINSNAPGYGAKVRVRGIGSINSSLDPTYVIDGVIGVDPNSLSPYDVASMEVLKDAAATSIFGARGANGVIIVTTKRGIRNDTRLTYDANVNVVELTRHLPTLNAQQFIDIYNQSYANGKNFDPNGAEQVPPVRLNHEDLPLLFDENDQPLYNTNWEKETYKPAISHSHNINLQGGSDKSLYSLSAGYQDQNGLMINSWFKRYNVRFTMDNDVTKWLKIGGAVNLIRSTQRVVSDANGALNVPRMVSEEVPIVPVKYPDGSWAGNFDIAGLEGGPNPVHTSENRYTLNNLTAGLGNVYLDFIISDELDFKSDFGFMAANNKNNFYSATDLPHLSQDQGGVASIRANTFNYWQTENYLTWKHELPGNSRMTVLAGASWQRQLSEGSFVEAQNFTDDLLQYNYLQAGALKSQAQSDYQQSSLNSYYARVMFDLVGKFNFTASGRYDGSSRLGSNQKYDFFPAIGAAWRLSEEDFMASSKLFSNVKIRASYGAVGNQEIGNYQSLAQIQPGTTVIGGALATIFYPQYLGNPNLKWEKSWQGDVGLEFSMFNGRVSGEIDYYNRVTRDLLLQAPIAWSNGQNNSNVTRNVGRVRNAGIEVGINTENIKTANFSWNTTFLFASNKNTVLALNEGNADIFPGPNFLGQNYVIRVGEPLGSFYGMTRLGTYSDKEAAEAAEHGLHVGDRKYVYNEDGSNYYSIIGRAYPKWTGTFNSKMALGNFDFEFDIRFVMGVNVGANFKHSVEDRQTIANSLTTVLNGWTPENQNTMISQVRNYKYAQDSHFDTWWVEDGSFVRGQNFILGYNFGKNILSRLHLEKARVYASVQNLFLITDYSGYDPEVDTFMSGYGQNSNFSQNLDFFSYPRPRTWNLGLNITL